MGCPGCLPTEWELQRMIDQATVNAKQNAIREKKLYIIYIQYDGTPAYMEAEAAKGAGCIPYRYISPYQ